MEIAAAVIGVILGFILSEFAQWIRASLDFNKSEKIARSYISIEIQHNLSVLEEIKQTILETNDDPDGRTALHRCYKFITLPFADFHDRAFMSQFNIIASSLEKNIAAQLLCHYDKITALNNLRSKMEQTKAREDHARIVASSGRSTVGCDFANQPYTPFLHSASEYWKLLDQLMTEISTNGNPL